MEVNRHKNSTIECTLTFAIASQESSFSEAMLLLLQFAELAAFTNREWSSTAIGRLLPKRRYRSFQVSKFQGPKARFAITKRSVKQQQYFPTKPTPA